MSLISSTSVTKIRFCTKIGGKNVWTLSLWTDDQASEKPEFFEEYPDVLEIPQVMKNHGYKHQTILNWCNKDKVEHFLIRMRCIQDESDGVSGSGRVSCH